MLKKDEKLRIKKQEPKDDDDPVYREKMEKIQANKGDKKLKSDENYDVPEEQRRDAKKQRYEMILLEQGLHNIQKDHNEKIITLRNKKAEIVLKAKEINTRLAEINKELKIKEELFQPLIDEAAEYPEKYYEVSDPNLVEHLTKEKEAEQKDSLDAIASRKDSDAEEKKEDYYDSYLIDKPKEAGVEELEEEKLPPERKDLVKETSDIETLQNNIKFIELQYEKECLQTQFNKMIADFDAEVENLQHAKLNLESDKKYGEMKLIISYEALSLLKGLVDRDTELTERLSKCKQEKVGIAKQFNEIAVKMREKDMLMNNLKDEKEQIMNKFDELIPVNLPYRDILLEYFQRKIKRKAKAPEEDKA